MRRQREVHEFRLSPVDEVAPLNLEACSAINALRDRDLPVMYLGNPLNDVKAVA